MSEELLVTEKLWKVECLVTDEWLRVECLVTEEQVTVLRYTRHLSNSSPVIEFLSHDKYQDDNYTDRESESENKSSTAEST